MFYEISITWRTIRKEGWHSLLNKVGIYFSDIFAAAIFILSPKQKPTTPSEILDFVWRAGRGLICPSQEKAELSGLLQWMNQRPAPQSVLEIGTARGGTLFCWCTTASPMATIISLDLPQGIHGGGYPYWKTFIYRRFAKPKQHLHLLRGDSHSPVMLDLVKKLIPPGGLDFLFIDGDHTLEGVRKDFDMYAPLVKSGGAVVFHDICIHRAEYDCHVDKFWNEVKQGRSFQEFVKDPLQGIYGIGVITMDSNIKSQLRTNE